MPKRKLFIWKILHNSITVNVNLRQHGMNTTEICQICSRVPEDCQHLVRIYPLASDAWITFQLKIVSQTDTHIPIKVWIIAWLR